MRISTWILGISLIVCMGIIDYFSKYINSLEYFVEKIMTARPDTFHNLQDEAYELFEKQPNGAGRVVKRKNL